MLPLCKFYRYLIYRLYHFRDDSPVVNVIVTLSSVHLMQLYTIKLLLWFLFSVNINWNIEGNQFLVFMFLFMGVNYLLLYNKKKWETYDEEFKNETPEHKKKGLILVLSYLIGSIVIFFAIHIMIGLYQDSLK